MNKKAVRGFILILLVSMGVQITSFAGQWKSNDIGWWYEVDATGAYPRGGWCYLDDTWYCFDANGYMVTGWQKAGDGNWYYLHKTDGNMMRGWQLIDGKWYFFHNNGIMAENEWVGNYYLGSTGEMAVNRWIGNYWVGSDGKYVNGYGLSKGKYKEDSNAGAEESSKNQKTTQSTESTKTNHQQETQSTAETQKEASTLSISGATKPEAIEEGKWFGLYGIISSNYKIEEVQGRITQNGAVIQSKTVYPGVTNYDLHGEVNDALIFNNLSVGVYTYQVKARDASGTNRILVEQQFKVVPKNQQTLEETKKPASTLSISGETKPQSIEEGNWFGLYGLITSNYKIEAVQGRILQNGSTVQSKTVYPGTMSYEIHGPINDALIFDNLSVGTYIYQVTAKDVSGASKVLIDQKFEVVAKDNPVQFTVEGGDFVEHGTGDLDNNSENEMQWDELIREARSYVGRVPYVWGGETTNGWDCSGFICYVYAQFGFDLTPWRTRIKAATIGTFTPMTDYGRIKTDCKPGDILIFPGHVAIYSGNGKMIHALNARYGTVETDANRLWSGQDLSGYFRLH